MIFKKITKGLIIAITGIGLYGCAPYYQGPPSDHFDGEVFFNPDNPDTRSKNLFTFLKWRFFGGERTEWPDYVEIQSTDIPPARVYGDELRVSYVGHATLLIQTQGMNILTDPMWSQRASPLSFVGPKRIKDPGIKFEDLPIIDIVLISHNHYDHLDLRTIDRLWEKNAPRIITPLGNNTIIRRHNRNIGVESYDWWESTKLNQDLTLHVIPVQHWSARTPFDRNWALWSGFVIDGPDGAIYFSGDLGFGKEIVHERVRDKFPNIRFAAIGIGAFEPRWFMEYSHLGPDEAVELFQILGASYGLGIHEGVFLLGGDGYTAAADGLKLEVEKSSLEDERFRTIEVGQSWNIPLK